MFRHVLWKTVNTMHWKKYNKKKRKTKTECIRYPLRERESTGQHTSKDTEPQSAKDMHRVRVQKSKRGRAHGLQVTEGVARKIKRNNEKKDMRWQNDVRGNRKRRKEVITTTGLHNTQRILYRAVPTSIHHKSHTRSRSRNTTSNQFTQQNINIKKYLFAIAFIHIWFVSVKLKPWTTHTDTRIWKHSNTKSKHKLLLLLLHSWLKCIFVKHCFWLLSCSLSFLVFVCMYIVRMAISKNYRNKQIEKQHSQHSQQLITNRGRIYIAGDVFFFIRAVNNTPLAKSGVKKNKIGQHINVHRHTTHKN